MNQLKIRNLDFKLTDDIPFIINPSNIMWSKCMNALSLFANAYEGYLISGVRKAIPYLKDESVKKEAILFCGQEATHSKHHNAHLKLVVGKYPELSAPVESIDAIYNDLKKNSSLKYNLAYAAITEMIIGPAVKFAIDNRNAMFGGCDKRIYSFFMWHFVEEFEHRHSALKFYHEVYGKSLSSYLYRLVNTPKILFHFVSTLAIGYREVAKLTNQYEKHIGNTASETPARITFTSWFELVYRILITTFPFYNPNNLPSPKWARQWFVDESRGFDMSLYNK